MHHFPLYQISTADMQELGFECFNFIVSYGGRDEAAIIVHQQLGAVEEMSHQSSTVDEFWALRVPRNCIAHNVPGTALGPPFWFRYARSQNVLSTPFCGRAESEGSSKELAGWRCTDCTFSCVAASPYPHHALEGRRTLMRVTDLLKRLPFCRRNPLRG